MTPEEVTAVHVRIALLANERVWFDNPITGMREVWENGIVIRAVPSQRSPLWNTDPNPWTSDNNGMIVPY